MILNVTSISALNIGNPRNAQDIVIWCHIYHQLGRLVKGLFSKAPYYNCDIVFFHNFDFRLV